MARPSKLTPAQWKEAESRLLAGEPGRAVAKDFGVSETALRKKFGGNVSLSAQSSQVKLTAEKIAEANTALEALPPSQRPVAISLADSLRNASKSLAKAGELGADTSQRLHEMASAMIQKVDQTDPGKSIEALKGVGVLAKLANESASIALNLLAANKDRMPAPETPKASGLAKRLSSEALREIVAAKNASD